MFTPFLYFTAMLSIFTARTSAAPKNMAWLYSGEYDTCNLEQWDESLADSEKGRNMDGDSCITGQPTGDGRRRFVWVPYLRAQYYGQKDGVEDYCLVMFEEDKCPREKDCNYKHTLDIRLNSECILYCISSS